FSANFVSGNRSAHSRNKFFEVLFREWSGADFPKLSTESSLREEIRVAPFPKQLNPLWYKAGLSYWH
ncbi:MAG: hypothetical protein ABFS56_28415, partial [Pseudomonadota bacterium]